MKYQGLVDHGVDCIIDGEGGGGADLGGCLVYVRRVLVMV